MRQRNNRDEGMILPIVLVISMVSAMVVIALANYVTTDLRYGKVVEDRADRLAAADGGLRYGVEQLRNFHGQLGALCGTAAATGGGYTPAVPACDQRLDHNGHLPQGRQPPLGCRRLGSDRHRGGRAQRSADVRYQGSGTVPEREDVQRPRLHRRPDADGHGRADGDRRRRPLLLVHQLQRATLDPGDRDRISDVRSRLLQGCRVCRPAVDRSLPRSRRLPAPPTTLAPAPVMDGACTVFSPGKYTSLALGSDNYFKAGEYYFENVPSR